MNAAILPATNTTTVPSTPDVSFTSFPGTGSSRKHVASSSFLSLSPHVRPPCLSQTPTLAPKTSKMKCTPAAPSTFLVSPDLKMKVAKTLFVLGLAVVGLAGVAFLDSHGIGNSLRGGSPTKPSSTRAAVRRALLETVAYGTRQANRRRLKETAMNCGKVDTIAGDVLGCVYPSNPLDQSGTQAHCLFDSAVQDGLLAPDSALVPLLESKSEIFNARPGHVTYPYGEAVSHANGMRSICAAPVEGEDRRRGLSTMSQVSLTLATLLLILRFDVADFIFANPSTITLQDTFVTQAINYFKENEEQCVGHESVCHDLLLALEIGLSVADLG